MLKQQKSIDRKRNLFCYLSCWFSSRYEQMGSALFNKILYKRDTRSQQAFLSMTQNIHIETVNLRQNVHKLTYFILNQLYKENLRNKLFFSYTVH